MTALVTLAEYAHARAGDKGNILSIAVFPLDEAHYAWLVRELTSERVASWRAAAGISPGLDRATKRASSRVTPGTSTPGAATLS